MLFDLVWFLRLRILRFKFQWCGSWTDVSLLAVNGTTGESMSLSVEERKLLAEEWCRKAKGKWVIAGNWIFTQNPPKITQRNNRTSTCTFPRVTMGFKVISIQLKNRYWGNVLLSTGWIRWLFMLAAWVLKTPKNWWVMSWFHFLSSSCVKICLNLVTQG